VKVAMKNQKGASAVEFAIILPLLVVFVFGIIEFGILFYDKAVVTNASREGARAGIVFKPDPRVDITEIENVVLNYCGNWLITFGSGPGPSITVPSGACANSGDELAVTVTYQYEFLVLPNFLTNFFSGSMPGTTDLSAVTRMRCE
jgi:Flp pilus assembly protein TadG